MSPRTIHRPWYIRWLFRDAPQPCIQPVVPRALLERACEVCHFSVVGNLGADADDEQATALMQAGFAAILRDYRAGKAQTPPEMAIGKALHHIARKYMEA